MQPQPNNSTYRTVVVLWLTLSIASVLLAAVTWAELSRNLEASRRAVALRDELDHVLLALVDAEAAQRGFALTGDGNLLGRLNRAESDLPLRFDRIFRLVNGDAPMLREVMELRAKVEVGLAFHRAVVTAREDKGLDAATELVASPVGKETMEEVRDRVGALRDLRHDLVAGGDAGTRDQLFRAILTSLSAGIIGVGAGIYALRLARVTRNHQEREKRLVEANREVERSSREKTIFLANMSHEIRTPMNAILGFGELLGAEIRDPRQRQYVDALRTSAHSLLQLINDILDMSRIEAGVMQLRIEPTDPREICAFVHTVFSEPAAKKGVKLTCKVADDLPRALLLDRIRLRQVIVNLVGNAVKFTDRGRIDVRVDWEKEDTAGRIKLLIEVQDTGVGIPPDKLEAIFSPFVQAGAHLDKEKSGTGLGLSIVRRLTEAMGGTATAASVMGEGSAFSLRFSNVPVSARLASRDRLETPGAGPDFGQLRPATILLVDDNEANRHLAVGIFAGTAHRLVACASGKEALEQLQTLRPDIILLDIRMPAMDGRETLARIRRIPGLEMTPVIAVTASSLLSEDEELKRLFGGYLRKPFTQQQLFDELGQFLPPRATDEPADRPESPADRTPSPAPPEVLAELERLRTTEWPAIRDSVAINESKRFAQELLRLARQWPCPPLERYALALDRHADDYSVVELEMHLFDFASLVDRLGKGAAS